MKRVVTICLLALALAACKTKGDGPGAAGSPPLSLVGQGLAVQRAPLPVTFAAPQRRAANSLWGYNNQGLFRDLRASAVGDIVTINIDIDDKAQFDNASGRSRQGNVKGSLAAALGFEGFGIPEQSGDIAGSLDAGGSASSKGEGSIDRSEKLHLSIAALVVEVLPDGNLLISGSQEARVNHEVRVLSITGIVRPVDIGSNNQISYEKIAEARISYGGRGKISAVQ